MISCMEVMWPALISTSEWVLHTALLTDYLIDYKVYSKESKIRQKSKIRHL